VADVPIDGQRPAPRPATRPFGATKNWTLAARSTCALKNTVPAPSGSTQAPLSSTNGGFAVTLTISAGAGQAAKVTRMASPPSTSPFWICPTVSIDRSTISTQPVDTAGRRKLMSPLNSFSAAPDR